MTVSDTIKQRIKAHYQGAVKSYKQMEALPQEKKDRLMGYAMGGAGAASKLRTYSPEAIAIAKKLGPRLIPIKRGGKIKKYINIGK